MGLRVLVTGAGGDSAQGVIRALRRADHGYVIASVCINRSSPGLYMSDIRGYAPPVAQEDEYVDFLIEFIKRNSIDILIPTIDSELYLVSNCREKIEAQTNVRIIIGSPQAVRICTDKLATSKYLDSKGVSQPETMTDSDVNQIRSSIISGSKILMKPRLGGGSKGIRLLDEGDIQRNDWINDNFIYQHFDTYSKEFTAVVMKDNQKLVASAVFERVLIGGRTMWCKRVPIESYESILSLVSEGLDIPYLNIQFGMVGDSIHVFDLNPRFSGSTGVFSLVFNGPHLLAQKFHSGTMPPFTCADEYFESVRYYDDLIIQLGK